MLDLFQIPSALWLLAALVPLTLLHLFRTRPRKVTMPSLRLWQASPAAGRPSLAIDRIRTWRSFIMQALVVLLASLGAAGLQFPDGSRNVESLVFVIDISASMQAQTNEMRSRLDQATVLIEQRMKASDPRSSYGIALLGKELEIAAPLGSGRSEIFGLLEELRASERNWPKVEIHVQDGLLRDLNRRFGAEAGILYFSGPSDPEFSGALPASMGQQSVGSSLTDNTGITALEVRRTAEGARIIGGVHRHGDGNVPVVLERGVGERWQALTADNSGTFDFAISGASFTSGAYRLRVEWADLFPADDAVAFHLNPRTPLNVGLVRLGPEAVEGASDDEYQLVERILRAFGASINPNVGRPSPSVLIVEREAQRSDDSATSGVPLTYTDHPWWQGLALDALLLPEPEEGIEVEATDQVLLSLAGKPVITYSNTDAADQLTIASYILEDQRFATSDSLLVLIGRWYRELEDKAFGAFAEIDPGALLSPEESNEVTSGSAVNADPSPTLTKVDAPLPLWPWLLSLAFLVMIVELAIWLRARRIS